MVSDDNCAHESRRENPATSDGGRPFLSRILGALAHQRRRYVLYYLHDHERTQTDDLAVQVAAWEQDIPITDVPAEEAEQVKMNLVHSHLPKLEDHGLVEYDQRSDAVSYTHPPALLEEALELAATIENPP